MEFFLSGEWGYRARPHCGGCGKSAHNDLVAPTLDYSQAETSFGAEFLTPPAANSRKTEHETSLPRGDAFNGCLGQHDFL